MATKPKVLNLSAFEQEALRDLLGYMVNDRKLLAQNLLGMISPANPWGDPPFLGPEIAAFARIYNRLPPKRDPADTPAERLIP
jgi:hypothetical protein